MARGGWLGLAVVLLLALLMVHGPPGSTVPHLPSSSSLLFFYLFFCLSRRLLSHFSSRAIALIFLFSFFHLLLFRAQGGSELK